VHAHVGALARAALEGGRIPAVLGGDHSTPYGAIAAVAEAHPGLGILHVDAHADLRDAYLGFRWSHASIFHNVLQLPGVARQVGVGWRDLGAAEFAAIAAEPDRIAAWLDRDLDDEQRGGISWDDVCRRIVDDLPQIVHVSVDIDGLDPALCPNTGTPVPGGLSWRQVCTLLRTVSERRRVVGFDLCEVSPGPSFAAGPLPGLRSSRAEWDANVGARMLYKLAGCAVRSRGRGR
jgi:agmatinase